MVARVPTASRTLWFKANPPAARFEPALLVALGADVHPGNIFAASGTPFDWGAAAVTHPFSSLLVALRTAAQQPGLAVRSPEVAVLTASYLSPWLEARTGGPPLTALSLALRIALLARALTWGRLFPCCLGHPAPAVHAARALAALLEPDPLD